MPTTKHPMLSWTHTIFYGLQDSLADSLHLLPNNTPASLCRGLLNANQKLGDYYRKSNESPYYTWASHMSCILLWYTTSLTSLLVLDPWISYSGLLADCGDALNTCAHLEATKECLHAHLCAKYNKLLPAPAAPAALTSVMNNSPQKVDFTSCYWDLPQAFMDEVQEYFKLPHENFDTCDPLQWWAGHSQFPNLSCFARYILSIPCEFTPDFFFLFNH